MNLNVIEWHDYVTGMVQESLAVSEEEERRILSVFPLGLQ